MKPSAFSREMQEQLVAPDGLIHYCPCCLTIIPSFRRDCTCGTGFEGRLLGLAVPVEITEPDWSCVRFVENEDNPGNYWALYDPTGSPWGETS